MELIPIIYTALIIFVIITIVTIISSYISYKVRRKTGNLDNQEREKFTKLHENATSSSKIVKKVKVRHHSKKRHPESDHKRKKEHKEIPEKERVKRVEPEKSERINILNKSVLNEPVKPVKPEDNKKKESKLLDLGDNILEKYADDNNDSFHSLNATKDEE